MSKLTASQSIIQTPTFGNVTAAGGTDFNDLAAFAKFPDQNLLDKTSPIERIDFNGVDNITKMKVHYPEEVIINVLVVAGDSADNPIKPTIIQLTFTVFNTETGVVTTRGPFGDDMTAAQTYFVEGPVVAFAGKADVALNALSIFSKPML